MPDFNRSGVPFRVAQGDSMIDILNKAPNKANIPYTSGADDTESFSSATDLVNNLLTTGDFSGKGKTVTDKELAENKRYPFFNPTIPEYEDFAAQGQGWAERAVNGIGKGLLLTGTTALQSTIGLLYGSMEWARTGKPSSFYNNSLTQEIDKINKASEDYLPNYYTNKERDARWYSPTKLFTANFLFDGIIKNLGFTAGSAVSAMGYANVLKALPYVSKLFTVGKAAETLAATEEAIAASANSAATLGKIKSLSDKFVSSYNILNPGGRALVGGLSTIGEGSFEAYNTSQELRNELIEEYKSTHEGREPYGLDLSDIDSAVAQAGNSAMIANMALLTATQYIQLPKILGSSYTAEKGLINSLKKDIGEVVLENGKYVEKVGRGGKILTTLNKTRPYTFSSSEAFEEGAQFAITKGVQDYYDKKYNNEAYDFISSVAEGISKTIGSDEGMENILMGGLSGAISMARGKYKTSRTEDTNTKQALSSEEGVKAGFNTRNFSQFTKETIDAVNRGVTLQQEKEEATKQGNVKAAKDKEADYIINYLTPRIKYGRYDLVMNDIDNARTLASTEEGWQQLINDGKALETDTREAYINRLANLENIAGNIKSLYQSLNLRYGNIVDDKGVPVYSQDVMSKMIYAASKVVDYDKRLQQLSLELNKGGILNTSAIVNDVVNGSTQEYNNAVKQILSMTSLNKDQQEDLGTALKDIEQIALDRTLFLRQYNDIKSNPNKYKTDDAVSLEEPEFINDKKEKEKIKEGREYELLEQKTAKIIKKEENEWEVVSPNGSVQKFDNEESAQEQQELINKELVNFAKIKVRSINPNGTVKVELVDGTIFNINPINLEGYKKILSEQEIVEQTITDEERVIIDNAIIQNELLGTNNKREQVVFDEGASTFESNPKKTTSNVINSTITSSKLDQPHHVRANNFGFHFRTMPAEKKEGMKIVALTQKTEAQLGLSGLTQFLKDEGAVGVEIDPKTTIVGVITKDGKLVDGFGETFELADDASNIRKAVFQVFPLEKLTATYPSGVETMFRAGVSEEERKFYEAEYAEWRKATLAKTTLDENDYEDVGVSFGVGEFIKNRIEKTVDGKPVIVEQIDYTTKTPVENAGLVENVNDFENKHLLTIPTTNDEISEGTTTLKNALGKVFFKLTGVGLERLNNRKLNKKEAQTIFDVILQVCKNEYAKQSKLSKEEKDALALTNKRFYQWLDTILYWGIPKNVQTGQRKTPGFNSVWFEKDVDGVVKLFVSGTGTKFTFTPTSLESNKTMIITLLEGMYHDVNSPLVNEYWNKPYTQIIGVENGQPVVKRWKNYQSYLLASTNTETGEKRNSDEIPLSTILRPVDSKEDTNRKGIYFIRKPKESKVYKAPAPKQTQQETPSSSTQINEIQFPTFEQIHAGANESENMEKTKELKGRWEKLKKLIDCI